MTYLIIANIWAAASFAAPEKQIGNRRFCIIMAGLWLGFAINEYIQQGGL